MKIKEKVDIIMYSIEYCSNYLLSFNITLTLRENRK